MKIVVDGFGGDNAPLAVLEGCAMAVKEYGVELIVTGDQDVLRKTAEENGISLNGISFHHAPSVITMEDEPTSILKEKADCSMAAAFQLVKEGKGDAFVSAGNTGAILVGATFLLKRVKGVKRAALASVIPTETGRYLLMDSGANVECRPEILTQFGVMGSLYMEKVMKVKSPKVGLVNIGTEETKGGELQIAALAQMKAAPIRFAGNVEAREAVYGQVDVIVSDGYSGNIFLKTMEGTGGYMAKQLKAMFTKNIFTKLAAALVADGIRSLKKSMDAGEVGGTALLGISRPVIKAHGSSDDFAIKNAIRQAQTFAASGIIDDITENIDHMKLPSDKVEKI